MRSTTTALLVVLALVLVACGDDDGTTATTAATTTPTVPTTSAMLTISGFSFGEPISVAADTQVTITNQDGATHTWTSADGLWDSGPLRGDDTFSFTFTEPGEFAFMCNIHASMTGTITVTG